MNNLINKQFTILSTHHSRPIMVDMRFKADNKPKQLVIFCHGFKGFKDWGHFNQIANEFVSRGYIFLKFNFSHNGTTVKHPLDFVDLEAFGNNNITTELNDLKDVIDAVVNKHLIIPDVEIADEKIFLIGHSRGGGIVILKAGEDERIKGTCAWAPVDDFKERYSGEMIAEWKKKGVHYIQNSRTGQDMPLYYQMVEDIYGNVERTDIPAVLKELKTPLLAIHGTDDETLNYENTKNMKAINPEIQILIINNANHTFGGIHPWEGDKLPLHTQQVIDATDKFFSELG